MKRWIAILLLAVAATNVGAQQKTLQIDVATDKHPHAGPLCIPLSVPKGWAKIEEIEFAVVTDQVGDSLLGVGQLTAPGITTESIKPSADDLVRRDLHVVLPMPAGKKWTLNLRMKETTQITRFAWTGAGEKKGEPNDLVITGASAVNTPVLRYMNRPYDTSSKDARDKSYKVFHHLYDPAGKRFVTNGGHTNDNASTTKLLYPHHRGIMYGFNKCTYGPDLKKKADTWHCTGDAHVAHVKTLLVEAGKVLGRHRVLLNWHGEKNEVFANEEREVTAYSLKEGTLVEFASRLKTAGGKIKVDGDPQHAGFQFRAHNDVAASTKNQTYYLHPDGSKGAMGKERNWPGDKTMVDLPWYAVSFVLDKNRYSVCYLNHPANPSETRFSERDYARFGGYFEKDITEAQPLVVNYRLWLQNGEMTAEQANGLRSAFASPPGAKVRAK